MTLTPYTGVIPNRATQTPEEFAAAVDTYLPWYAQSIIEMNALAVGSTDTGTFNNISLGSNGTASQPAIRPASEPNSGLYRPAAGQLGFSILGTLRHLFTATELLINNAVAYTRANILGTVSFSGGNTGAVFETGGSSLSTGYYRKTADGWFELIIQKTATSGAAQTVNFPAGLTAVDADFSVQATAEGVGSARFATIGTKTTTSFQFIGWTDAGNNAVTPTITFTVTGRWR
jgi:hypothetical protein